MYLDDDNVLSTHGKFIDPISSNSSSQNIDIQKLHLDNSGNPYRAVLWQESRLSLLIVLDPNNAEDDIVELAGAIHAMDLPRLCTEIDTSYRACSASKEYVLVLNQSALLTTELIIDSPLCINTFITIMSLMLFNWVESDLKSLPVEDLRSV